MQEYNITFQGINLSTPPDTCPDGQLESCVGLEMHEGALRPAVLQGSEYKLSGGVSGYVLKTLHTTSQYSHFILLSADSKTVSWADASEKTLTVRGIISPGFEIKEVKCVGNTLVILAENGLHYCLFKDGLYKYLGQKPPETVIQFHLISHFSKYKLENYYVNHREIVSDIYTDTAFTEEGYMDLKEEFAGELTLRENQIAAKLSAEAAAANRIIYPVLVRYAYRMYDDSSFIMQSSPVLLVPNTDVAPIVAYQVSTEQPSSLLAAAANESDIVFSVQQSALDDWKDIILSVDIFMTEQLSSRSADVKITQTVEMNHCAFASSLNYGFFTESPYPDAMKTLKTSWWEYQEMVMGSNRMYILYGDKMKDPKFNAKPEEASVFYRVRSIPVSEIKLNEDTYLFDIGNPSSVSLGTLVFQETLPDDYQSHDKLIPSSMFVYNKRLNIADIQRKMFGGYDTTAMIQNVQHFDTLQYHTIFTHIKKDSKEIVVKNHSSGSNSDYLLYLFYPDPDAYMMTIVKGQNPVSGQIGQGCQVMLKKHPLLNGSVWFIGFGSNKLKFVELTIPEVTDAQVNYGNLLAVSEVDNPFAFPLSHRYTIGSGHILGLSSIVTPLSQGQFGTFDLMILTSEGNYAASVTDEGTYSNIHPMQRDVCINPSAIVPTDYSILFISAKGLMSANGSVIEHISEALGGVFPGGEIPDMAAYLSKCSIAYDYAGQRIILASPNSPYALARSASGLWSMAEWGEITAVVNVFPYSYIQRGASIIRLDQPYDAQSVESQLCSLVTRPMKLGSLQLKHIHQLSVEGVLGEMEDMTIYASRDAVTWFKIGTTTSSHVRRMAGRPFKYWKVEICMHLNGQQNISGIRLQVQHRKETRYR